MNRLRRLPTILTGVLALLIAWIEKRDKKRSATTATQGAASPSDRVASTGTARRDASAGQAPATAPAAARGDDWDRGGSVTGAGDDLAAASVGAETAIAARPGDERGSAGSTGDDPSDLTIEDWVDANDGEDGDTRTAASDTDDDTEPIGLAAVDTTRRAATASSVPSSQADAANAASESASIASERSRGGLDTAGAAGGATGETSRAEDTSERIDDAVSDESAEFIEDAWGPDDDVPDGATATAAVDDRGTGGDDAAATVPAGAVAGDGTVDCPADHPIKGNASSRIYHEPGRSSYARTIPEFCFATPEDAEAAGFRAPQR